MGKSASSSFRVGWKYTRSEIQDILRVPVSARGGNWFTGYHKHNGAWFVFCNVGKAGRTGHDYVNYFEGDDLLWEGKTGSHIGQPSILDITSGGVPVLIFFRLGNRDPFIFAGSARATHVEDAQPIRVRWRLDRSPMAGSTEER